MSGLLKRVTLCELRLKLTNALIIGVIIAKQQPHVLKNSLTPNRAVWSFTVRDSRIMYINVTFWGSTPRVSQFYEKFDVGDVVELHRPLIEIRKGKNNGEQFCPNVTSPYYLIISDDPEITIKKFEGNCSLYEELMHLPTNPIAGAYTIFGILSKRENLQDIDILGVLRLIGKKRSITTRDGQTRSVRDVTILDRSNDVLRVRIWEPHIINRAETWNVNETVLFITEVQCTWSDFLGSMVAMVTANSIITENPIGNETESLKTLGKETAIFIPYGFQDLLPTFPNPATIKNVMNVKQILLKAQSSLNSPNVDDKEFCALLFAFVTHLDPDISRSIIKKCPKCRTTILSSATACSIDSCLAETVGTEVPAVSNFYLRLTLSDNSGSLSNCSLSGLVAQSVLHCNVQQFLKMTDERKSNVKWQFLKKRCEIRIAVSCVNFRDPVYTILSCEVQR